MEDVYSGFAQPSMETLYYEMEPEENQQGIINPGTATLFSRGNLMSSRLKTGEIQLARPSTAIRPVGYTSEAGRAFDTMLQKKSAKKETVWERKKQEPQEKYKNLEFKIQTLLEESILAGTGPRPNYSLSLTKAKEASTLDRTLLRLRDQNGGTSFHNFDLTFSVLFNLAVQYTKNEMYVEALNTYNAMIKNKMFPNVNRLKVNMGNIYFHMGVYSKAVKMYRMALDQVPNNHKEIRLKITHNIGILFIKMGQYTDAAASFEFIMSEKADIKSGMHLVLCYYAMGDIEKIKTAFRILMEVQLDHEDDAKNQTDIEENQANQYVFETIKNDELAIYCRDKKKVAERCIVMIVDLISSVIEETYNEGYTWCTEVIKTSNFAWLANELELNKALVYLRQNEISQAIDTLRFYEKKEPDMAAGAMNNLTFIYFYLGDITNASKYAEKCRKIDSYNPAAFINSSVCEYASGNFEGAKQYLESALAIDMTSFEANYNLGLVLKKMGETQDAANTFNKIRQNLSHAKHPHIFYQLGSIQELQDQTSVALDWYLQLVGVCQEMDPGIYQKIGEIYENLNDRQEANQYYNEAYRINPCDVNIASSIASYYIKLQAVEKAIFYYERAVLSNPTDPNLMLRVASCFRHIYSSRKYLSLFEKIYNQFPENLACLRALIHVSKSIGMMDEFEKYSKEYTRVERTLQTRKTISAQNRQIGNRSSKKVDSPKVVRRPGTNERGSYKSNVDSMQEDSSYGNLIKSYNDPLGPPAERPRTGQVQRSLSADSDDDMNAEELLPM